MVDVFQLRRHVRHQIMIGVQVIERRAHLPSAEGNRERDNHQRNRHQARRCIGLARNGLDGFHSRHGVVVVGGVTGGAV